MAVSYSALGTRDSFDHQRGKPEDQTIDPGGRSQSLLNSPHVDHFESKAKATASWAPLWWEKSTRARTRWLLVSALVIAMFIGLYVYTPSGFLRPGTSIPGVLTQLPFNQSAIDPFNQPSFFSRPLGKKLLILDVDSRPWDIETALPEQSLLAWGRLNHYLYASMHNYDYKFVQAQPFEDRSNTWVKVEETYKALQQGYQFVVFTDADIVFPHLQLPLETLMTHWNITRDIALAGAIDPDNAGDYDEHGQLNLNTGFLIAQQTPVTDQLFRDWIDCPTEVKYPGCAHWKNDYFHEQSALANFVRFDYADSIRRLPCDEANGSPNLLDLYNCTGKYVLHQLTPKDRVTYEVKESIVRLVLPGVHAELLDAWSSVLVDHSV